MHPLYFLGNKKSNEKYLIAVVTYPNTVITVR